MATQIMGIASKPMPRMPWAFGLAATALELTYTDAQTLGVYTAITGFNPADPNTDQGTNPDDLFSFWKATGLPGGHKIADEASVDPTDTATLALAGWLFGGLGLTLSLPDVWFAATNGDGFVWDAVPGAVPDPNNGHMVLLSGYGTYTLADGKTTATGWKIETWGMWGVITPAGLALCDAAIDAVLSADWAPGTSLSPAGYSFADTSAIWTEIGGNPTPAPPVPPGPTPPPPVPPTPGPAFPWTEMLFDNNGNLIAAGTLDSASAALTKLRGR